jgi:Ca2+-binding RTX toxin-like protein
MSELINSYYDNAQLSLAAYFTLSPGPISASALVNADNGFSQSMADVFALRYTVLDQRSVGGFSATLFFDHDTQQKVIAIRGTNDFLDVLSDLSILFGTGGRFDSQYDALKQYYADLTNLIGLNLLQAGEQFSVTGHSLGGYLAQTFTADPAYSGNVLHAYTYNAPGYNGIWAEIAELVGFSPASTSDAQITNLFAENGLSATSGLGTLVGAVQSLFIEEGSATHNHSIVTLVDSLALYNLFGTIDPEIDISRLTGMLNAAGTTGGSSLEQTVYALCSVFQTPPNSLTLDTPLEADDRDAYYLNIETLNAFLSGVPTGTFTVESLVGQPAGTVAALAEQPPERLNPLAYRYAVTQLNPFVIHGADYDWHNTNGELELFNKATGTGTLTTEYLSDRAQFLAEKIAINLKDETTSDGTIYFYDVASGYEIGTNSVFATDQRFLFGSDNDDLPLLGASDADHLYGGGGNDFLDGQDGRDYLEGNAGNDELRGGTGRDILLGQQGNDILDGGDDEDRLTGGLDTDELRGGAGRDVYYVRSGFGQETITDSDGRGLIQVDQRLLVGGVRKPTDAARTYTSPDGQFRYVLSGSVLTISNQGSPGDNIVVQNFTPGQLGIRLVELPAEPTFDNGLPTKANGDFTQIVNGLEVPVFDETNNNVVLEGGYNYDIQLLGGNDSVVSNSGNDHLFGGAGGDALYGMEGHDRLDGGDENDILYGGIGDDWLLGGEGDDDLDGGPGRDYLDAEGGTGSQWLSGGTGSDILIGGAGRGEEKGVRNHCLN